MAQLNPEELGRRLRAARGYAGGTSQRAFAKELGIGESSLKRLEAGEEGPAEVKLEAIVNRAAEKSQLPRRFFESDLWVLDYLEQAISMLPEDVQARPRDEVIFEAFEAYGKGDAGVDTQADTTGEFGALQAKLNEHDELLGEIVEQLKRFTPPAEGGDRPAKPDQATHEPSVPDPPPIAPDPVEPQTGEEGQQPRA